MFRIRTLSTAAIVSAAMILTACGGGADGGQSDKSSIVIALGTEPNSLDGQRSSDGNARIVIQNIADELVKRDPDGKLIPGLAKEIPELTGDKTWEIKLRSDVTFHDGEELTSEVVVANIERMIDPDVATENGDIVGTIASAKATDDMTVEVTTKVPDPLLPSRLAAMPIMAPSVLDGNTANSKLVGTGPYELTEWDKGNSITLEANDDYWGEKPDITSVEFRFIPDPGSQEAGLRAGEIDLITNLSPDSVDSVPELFSGKSGESPAMILNTEGGVTQDVRVRRAMNMAIDQETLAESLFGGRATPQACQMSNAQLDYHNDELESYEYDVEAAKALISEAGAEGATVEVIGTSGRWLRDRETTEAVGAAWREIGLEPKVQILEFNNYLDVLFDRSERPDSIYISAGNPMLSVQSTLDSLYSADGGQGSNADKDMAKAVAEAGRTIDEDQRTQMLGDIMEQGCDQAMMAFLPAPENLYGGSEGLSWDPEPDASVHVSRMSWE